ncbi:hypothetical protein BD410DRAFT_842664 [Rickenella mellea]|uniref:Uncharacterized protein n=1 Tax=Rickenella mellea TaxID=50990 RepID=A0A4Y7PU54_9AGAM|nr:hypothetical protein BD410DRAFT_842664 [Rickenella mellea]
MLLLSASDNPVQLISQILALILDVLIFGLTFSKTIQHTIEMRKVGLGNGMGYFILRDGTMYFLAKMLFEVLGTTLFFTPLPDQNLVNWLDVTPSLGNSLAVVLAIRIVLNLRQVSSKQEAGGRSLHTIDTIRDPVFATNSFLGNIGAQLRIGPDDEDDFEEEASRDSDVVELDFFKSGVIADENEITEDSAPSHV